jgi:hypothetical protein
LVQSASGVGFGIRAPTAAHAAKLPRLLRAGRSAYRGIAGAVRRDDYRRTASSSRSVSGGRAPPERGRAGWSSENREKHQLRLINDLAQARREQISLLSSSQIPWDRR